MSENPFGDAMDDAAAEQEQEPTAARSEFDLERYFDAINSDGAPKNKTIGIATTEEMHAFYHELQDSDEVDVDVTQSLRDHLEKLAHRHDGVFEKAMRKLEIDREL